MDKCQAVALVARCSADPFSQELITFLIQRGYLSDRQMKFIFKEARQIAQSKLIPAKKKVSCQKKPTIPEKLEEELPNATKSQSKRFKVKYRLWEIQPILDELDCQVIRHPQSGYLLVDNQGDVDSGIRFDTYRDLVVWACGNSPEHPLADGIVD